MITKFVLDDPDTLIRAEYQSGFSFDPGIALLKIQITESGELTQVISWDRGYESEEDACKSYPYCVKRDVRFIQLSQGQIHQLRQAIEDLDPVEVQQARHETCSDDAESVTLEVPARDFQAELTGYYSENDILNDRLSAAARSGCRAFWKIWDLLDSFAPDVIIEQAEKVRSSEPCIPEPSWYDTVGALLVYGVWNLFLMMFILMLCSVPLFGVYELGKTVWYLSSYESDLGEVVGCHWKETEHSSGYAIVVQTKEGVRLTGSWYGSKENCVRQLGTSIKVLVNPANRQEAVLNTFIDRWLPALCLLGLTGLGLFIYFQKRVQREKTT